MNKQPGSTFSTSINESRSCYITTKRFAFLSVGRILARTIHISVNILNSVRNLFKNVNILSKRLEKINWLLVKRNMAHLAHRHAFRALIFASAEILKSLFVQAKFTQTLRNWTIHFSKVNNIAIVIPTIRGECATHRNCSQKCHTFGQQKIDSFKGV